jgi:hypothetical protein
MNIHKYLKYLEYFFDILPQKPYSRILLTSPSEIFSYLSRLLGNSTDFASFLTITEFYSKIYTRWLSYRRIYI